jgi:hypothetical protein
VTASDCGRVETLCHDATGCGRERDRGGVGWIKDVVIDEGGHDLCRCQDRLERTRRLGRVLAGFGDDELDEYWRTAGPPAGAM